MSHTSFILVGMHLNVNTDNKMLFKRQQGQFHGMHQLTKKENLFFWWMHPHHATWEWWHYYIWRN